MKVKLLALFITFAFAGSTAAAQDITGFWEVTKVSMGDRSMTPMAKWTKINPDGTFRSGNGWLQNATGTWDYDKSTQQFSPEEKNGITDDYGSFTVSFQDQNMLWKRMEDGSEVTVTLERMSEMPMSTADKLQGLWDLSDVSENEKDITSTFDPDNRYYLFIRWDRLYQEQNAKGERKMGYWHLNAHRPELTLISMDESHAHEKWQVEFTENELKLTGMAGPSEGLIMIFKRIHQFPD
jgi:hypothetical protein